MFIVKNVTKSDVSIPDLRVTLSPGDQIDLDMVSSRFYINQSSSLKRLITSHFVKCIFRDDGNGSVQIKMEDFTSTESQKGQTPQASPSDVMNAVKQMEEKLSRRLEEKISSQPQLDINAINQALQALQSIASQANNTQTKKMEDTNVVDERVVNIHERTLDRLSKKSESKVKHEEQTSDNNVNKNIEELEGLL